MRADVNIPEEYNPEVDPNPDRFVFDPDNPHVKALIKLGVPEDRLRQLSEDYAREVDSVDGPLPAPEPIVIEKRY